MKRSKKLQRSTYPDMSTRMSGSCDFDWKTGSRAWRTEDEIRALGPKLLQYIEEHKDVISLEEAFPEINCCEDSYREYEEKYPKLTWFRKSALVILANRRERGMVYLKYGMRDAPLMYMQGHYRKSWRDEQILRAKLKEQGEERPGIIKLGEDIDGNRTRNRLGGKNAVARLPEADIQSPVGGSEPNDGGEIQDV